MTVTDRLEAALAQGRRFAERTGCRDGEVLLVTGSSVLPFETSGGDVDLVLLTPYDDRFRSFAERRHPERRTEQLANGYAMSYLDAGGEEIDIEVWPEDRVLAACRALGDGIRDADAVEADFTRVGGLDVKVGTDLFHALRCGVPAHGAERLREVRSAVPWRTYQAFKRDCALVNVRDATKGIPASLRVGRPDEAYLKLCWAADSLADGLIFHHGLSISRWKWRLRYLPLLEPSFGDWYREVRFTPQLAPEALDRHVGVLRDAWRRHAGTEPLSPEPPEPRLS
ncbi:hypothetical protein RVR_491 [Actinacidiphila reveromycinica]|uniref:Nucleotidyltransferase n=1 Tax=Actinacidiphila reveromycinica TaxID=659352 RepID=A0A7U3UN34_9ACTN|nr:hypothetical protein [Streptomyces sp. SN-593]BBA95579.1 hypothetical protein RVR_491 [Streptomyces sp. SN-593]